MIFDVAVAVIIIFTMVLGFRRGFVFTFIHTVDWIIALAVAYIGYPKLQDFFMNKTTIYDIIFNNIHYKFSDSLENINISYELLPKAINEKIEDLTVYVSANLTTILTDFLFAVLCFILIVLIVKLVLWIILRLLSKKHRDGVTGFIDGILGMLTGFVKGFLIVSVLLALMLPVVNLFSPESIALVTEKLSDATYAKEIYDNNLIMLILKGFIN